MEKQFVLTKALNLSKQDVDKMTLFEIENWLELVKKQNELEKENLKV